MKWERWHGFAAIGVLLVGGFLGWQRCGRSAENADADAGPAESGPPAKVPDDLLGEVYVSSPNSTWTKLQRGIGGALGILPMTLPGVVVALSDLDVQLAGELDGTSPIHAALSGDPTDPEWAIAMKLVDGRRARGALIEGDTSRFDGKSAPGMTILVPKRAASPGEEAHATAITSNGWFLVARDARALPGLGTYVSRGLTAKPPPTLTSSVIIDVPHAALSGALAPKLKKLWGDAKDHLAREDQRMRAERGRPPDFGDPAAIIAALDGLVTRRIDILGDFDKSRISIDVIDDAVSLQAQLTPPAKGPAREWLDAMKTGDTAPVLALPSSAALALSVRDDDAARTAQAESLKSSLASVLGARLKDPAPLHAVIDAATKARGEVATLAVILDEPGGTLLRLPTRDAEAARTAATSAVELIKAEPFKDMFRAQATTFAREEVSGAGTLQTTMLQYPKPDAGPPRRPSGVSWVMVDKEAWAAFGAEPNVTLRAAFHSDKKLTDVPLKRFLDAIGNDASTIILAQPLKLEPKRSSLPALPAGLAIGKKEGDGFVRIDVPDALLREVARRQLGI